MYRAYFIGGAADGATRVMSDRPPDRMQAAGNGRGATLYTRNDIGGKLSVYVPIDATLHDALEKALDAYARSRELPDPQ